MSNWSSTQLTDLGRALDAKVTAGTTLLSFTKMKLGSGTETAEDIPAMTDLVSPKLVLGISSCAVSASDDTICELISVASSSDVEESFVVRELGVFATDPDVGEILYAVMLDSTPDTMPNENVSSPVTVTYQVNIVSANASSITAVIDPAGLVTASVLQAHNDSISAHKMAHWYRQNSKIYAVGDIAFSASLPSNLVLKCTTAGTTASTEPSMSGAEVGDVISDGTVTWTVQDLLGGGMHIGAVLPFLQTSIPDGWLSLENGALLTDAAYPELANLVRTGKVPVITESEWQAKAAVQKSVGYYSSGDGSTTFRLPRIIGFMEGTTAANVGQFTGAGLPNIVGDYAQSYIGSGQNAAAIMGAFTADATVQNADFQLNAAPGNTVFNGINFSASRSNPIYGNSNTVQPESVGMVWCVRAFGAATNQGTVDITELAQMLNLKLSIADAPAVCTPLGFPSDTYIQVYPSATGSSYTVPADGYMYFKATTQAAGGIVSLRKSNTNFGDTSITAAANALISVFIPVKKNDVIIIEWYTVSDGIVQFYYAQGEV